MTNFLCSSCTKDTSGVASVLNYLAPPVANAGPSKIIQAPVSTVTLTGSGTTHNGYITGYLWSLVSGPNVPVILSPSSPVTVINNMVVGAYIFQFMVTDSAGLVGIDTVSVLVKPGVIQTLTLQPTNNPDELLMIYYPAVGNYSYSTSTEILAHAWTNGGNTFNSRTIMKLDLSSIPAGATILSAKLSLYSINPPLNGNFIDANFGTNNTMYIERVTGNWTSSTLWQNQPATDIASQVVIPHTSLSFLDLIDLDVTNQVSAMKTIANYGFMFRLQNEIAYTMRDFCSSRYANAAKHPKLVITYQ